MSMTIATCPICSSGLTDTPELNKHRQEHALQWAMQLMRWDLEDRLPEIVAATAHHEPQEIKANQ